MHSSFQDYGESTNYVTDFKYLGSKVRSAVSDYKQCKVLARCVFFPNVKDCGDWRDFQLTLYAKLKFFFTTCLTVSPMAKWMSNSTFYSMTGVGLLLHCVWGRVGWGVLGTSIVVWSRLQGEALFVYCFMMGGGGVGKKIVHFLHQMHPLVGRIS